VLDDLLRFLLMIQTAFMVGMSAVILCYYIGNQKMRHILFMATSYIILAIITANSVWNAFPISSRVNDGLIFFSLILGDYGLFRVLAAVRTAIIQYPNKHLNDPNKK
jgi:hypothetical protein